MRTILLSLVIVFFSACEWHEEVPCNEQFSNGKLVHMVILKLKPEVSEDRKVEILELVNSLRKIEETKGLFTATKASTPDPRARTNYDIILEMAFNSKEDLEAYSQDGYHLKVRSLIKDDLESAPVVYDYWVN